MWLYYQFSSDFSGATCEKALQRLQIWVQSKLSFLLSICAPGSPSRFPSKQFLIKTFCIMWWRWYKLYLCLKPQVCQKSLFDGFSAKEAWMFFLFHMPVRSHSSSPLSLLLAAQCQHALWKSTQGWTFSAGFGVAWIRIRAQIEQRGSLSLGYFNQCFVSVAWSCCRFFCAFQGTVEHGWLGNKMKNKKGQAHFFTPR